jgi:hypothetical protein
MRKQMKLGREYYNALVEAENKRRQAAWGAESVPAPPHDDCKCAECKAHWAALHASCRASKPLDVKPLRTEFAAKGLFWGTYLCIEDAFARAWKTRNKFKLVKFRGWRTGGVIGVQIQRSTWDRRGTHAWYRINHAEDARTGRRASNGAGRRTVEIRLGSDKGKPLWSEPIPIEKHREIEGRVTWVKAQYAYRDGKELWSVTFTCADVPERTDEAKRGVVAVDVGWRQVDGSLRIAYARGDQGDIDIFEMGPRWLERIARANRIRGYRDTNLNELKKAYPDFANLQSSASARGKITELLAGGLVDETLATWADRDKHLSDYESGCRRRATAAREDAMNNWARRLRRRYATIILKKTATKKMKETAIADGMHRPARRQAHHAAPGEVIDYLISVFGRESENVFLVPAPHTTNGCPACDHVNDHGAETVVCCEECGTSFDRDAASTLNMMSLWILGECEPPKARKTTARFAVKHKQEDASPAA